MYFRRNAAAISLILSIGLSGLLAGNSDNSIGADTDPKQTPDSTKADTNLPTGAYGAGRSILTVDDLTYLPAHSFTSLAGLRMGAIDGSVRGGRPDGVSIYLENIRLDNAFRGYTAQDVPGNYSIGLSTELPELGLEKAGMVYGATPLRYGNAPDGVVNLVAREGNDQHQGRLRITTEGRFLANWNTVLKRDWLISPDTRLPPDLLADTDGDGVGDSLMALGGLLVFGDRLVDAAGLDSIHSQSKLDSFGYDYAQSEPIWTETRGDYDLRQVSYSFSGPLPGPLHYAISGEFLDPGSVPFLERERTNYNVLGKLTIQPSERLHLGLTWVESKQRYQLYSYGTANTGYGKYRGGYLPGYGPLYPSLAMLPFLFFDNQLVTGTLTYTPNANSRLNLTLGRSRSGFEQKMRDYDDRDGDGDYEEYLVFREIQAPGRIRLESGQYVDTLLWQWRLNTEDEELAYIWTWDPAKVNDSTYSGEWQYGNPALTAEDHLWSQEHPSGWRNIWRAEFDPSNETWWWYQDWRFATGWNEVELSGVTHPGIDDKIIGISGAYFNVWGDQFGYTQNTSEVFTVKLDYALQVNDDHRLETGLEYLAHDLEQFNITGWSTRNYYLDEWRRQPTEWAWYLGDSFIRGPLAITAGIRADSYSLGSDVVYSAVALDPDKVPVDYEQGTIVSPTTWDDPQVYWSPRVVFSYDIDPRYRFHVGYNRNYQRPAWRYFYENLGYSTAGAYEEIGNPELQPTESTSIQMGIAHQLTAGLILDITLFNKDISGWIQQVSGGDMPATHFWIYSNEGAGIIKGIDVSLSGNLDRYYSLVLNYRYSSAKGLLSDPQLGGTYLWRNLIAPKKNNLLDYDQLHSINLSVNIYIPPIKGPGSLYGDWRIGIVNRYGSGLPFDSQSRAAALTVPPENDERRPPTNVLDLRVAKRLGLGPAGVSLWLEVFNLLDRQNLTNDPVSSEWYLSQEDTDGDGEADHYQDPTGRWGDWTVYQQRRRVKVGLDVEW